MGTLDLTAGSAGLARAIARADQEEREHFARLRTRPMLKESPEHLAADLAPVTAAGTAETKDARSEADRGCRVVSQFEVLGLGRSRSTT